MTQQQAVAEEENEQDQDLSGPDRGRRAWTIVAVIAVTLALAAVGALVMLLLDAGSSRPGPDVMACVPSALTLDEAMEDSDGGHVTDDCPPADATHVDGMISKATPEGFEIVTTDGEERFIAIREPDRPYIDVQHARTHAALGQPVRIHLREVDGEPVAIYMTDILLGMSGSS